MIDVKASVDNGPEAYCNNFINELRIKDKQREKQYEASRNFQDKIVKSIIRKIEIQRKQVQLVIYICLAQFLAYAIILLGILFLSLM